jgi:hypothetical protein
MYILVYRPLIKQIRKKRYCSKLRCSGPVVLHLTFKIRLAGKIILIEA